MIRITITPAAYAAIAGSLPCGTVRVEPQRAENGDYFIWVAPGVVAKLSALRPWRELQRRHPAIDRAIARRRSVTTTGRGTPAPAMVKMPFQSPIHGRAMVSAPVGIVSDHPCGRAICNRASGRRRTTG
jgi:hypothetical protein